MSLRIGFFCMNGKGSVLYFDITFRFLQFYLVHARIVYTIIWHKRGSEPVEVFLWHFFRMDNNFEVKDTVGRCNNNPPCQRRQKTKLLSRGTFPRQILNSHEYTNKLEWLLKTETFFHTLVLQQSWTKKKADSSTNFINYTILIKSLESSSLFFLAGDIAAVELQTVWLWRRNNVSHVVVGIKPNEYQEPHSLQEGEVCLSER